MSENVRERIADIVARQTFTTDWMAESDPVGNATDRIIAVVRADERRRIRKALLSDKVLRRTGYSFSKHLGEAVARYKPPRSSQMAQWVLSDALAAIGLTEEGADHE